MSFSKLSPLFRQSLRDVIDKMASRQKEAGCSCVGGDDKKLAVDEVLQLIQEVDSRLVSDWLYALDGASREEVKRLFQELRNLSAAEFVLLMKSSGACCPWEFIGSMFSAEDEQASPQKEEIMIVEESPPSTAI